MHKERVQKEGKGRKRMERRIFGQIRRLIRCCFMCVSKDNSERLSMRIKQCHHIISFETHTDNLVVLDGVRRMDKI